MEQTKPKTSGKTSKAGASLPRPDDPQKSQGDAGPAPRESARAAAEREFRESMQAAAEYHLEEQAANLASVYPAFMASALALKTFEAGAYQKYLQKLLEESGSPTDPVQRMLIEQLALAHFRVGDLHVAAAQAQSMEAAKVLNSAAVRLQAEFRRSALALSDYRSRRSPVDGEDAKLRVYNPAKKKAV